MIAKDPQNADVVKRYLRGEDYSSNPDQSASLWVIDFQNWPLARAEQYSDCMRIVRERVYPDRMNPEQRATYEKMWWQFWRPRIEMYRTIAALKQVLFHPFPSKHLCFGFVPTGIIYTAPHVVVASSEYQHLAILQSSLHESWARKYGSTLETRLRYTPTDIFGTFPFPQQPTSAQRAALERLGEQYHEHRRQIMLARQEGLTKTYNRFHDPAEHSADIAELRRLHVEMDRAVLAAYGWAAPSTAGREVNLDHDFRGEGKEARYSLSEGVKEELLRRLLELNFQIAAEEEAESKKQDAQSAGGKTKKAGKKDGGKGRKKSGGDEAPSAAQLGLL